MSEKKVYKKWIKRGNNIFLPTETPKILPELESGYYDIRCSDTLGFYFLEKRNIVR